MGFKVLITKHAEVDYITAFKYYDEKNSQIGLKFELETQDLINTLMSNPYLFQRKYKHYREAIYKNFPYLISYEISENLVVIYSFFHARRNPKSKIDKIKK